MATFELIKAGVHVFVVHRDKEPRLLTPLEAELISASEYDAARLATLEAMRPHWAQGYTSDSTAAQASTAALSQLWGLLGVTSQTEAVAALKTLLEKTA